MNKAISPVLPPPSGAGGKYFPVVVHEGLAFVSGQLPRLNGVVQLTGKLGRDLDLASGREAARLCAMQCLAALDQELGGLARLVRLLKVTGYVASAEGFTDQPLVIDSASEYFEEILASRGRHARAAIGVIELPRGASVEIDVVAAVRD